MTVLRHFGLKEQPFGVTPDPRFLYATSTHREALASILYGLESGLGFVSLIAQPGMGKTTLLFEALRRVADSTRSVFLFQTISNPRELVHSLLMDLGEKDITGNLVEMQSRLNEVLVNHQATGKRLVVVIDEAQNLNTVVLESVRMLSNFETAGHKLLQIVLAGQPQLAEKLVSPELLQLRQRISIFAHLDPLQSAEATAYIQHRLRIAGCDLPEALFTKAALTSVFRASEGIPRNINNICFNALSLGYALQKRSIDADVIEEVLRDLDVRTDYVAPLPSASPKEELSEDASARRPARLSRLGLWAICVFGLACVALALLAGVKIGSSNGPRGLDAARPRPAEMSQGQPSAIATVLPAHPNGEATQDSSSLPSVTREGTARVSKGQQNAPDHAPDIVVPAHPLSESRQESTPSPATIKREPPVAIKGQQSPAVTLVPAYPTIETKTRPTVDSELADANKGSGSGTASAAAAAPAGEVGPDPSKPSSAPAGNAPMAGAGTTGKQFVVARVRQNIYGICKETFGRCTADMLHRIIEMNPGIPDPNRIMPGQRILVPALPQK